MDRLMGGGGRTIPALLVTLAVLLAVHPMLPGWAVNMVGLSLANGLAVLGLLVIMRAGLVSFGHGLYFGLGSYGAAMAATFLGVTDAFLMIAIGMASAALVAFVLGFLMARYRGIFFALLNLAFSMLLYGLLVNSAVLGSTDGFSMPIPSYLGYAPVDATSRVSFLLYALICVLAFAAALVVHRYLQSTMGYIGEGIRENEVRVEYLGASVRRAIHIKYVIAAAITGLGGVLTVLLIGHVTPEDTVYWTKSGELVFVAILSGTGSVAAPFLGSMLFELVRTYALQYAPDLWQMLLGATLLAVIMFLPGGLWSVVRLARRKA
ncbi:MAG: branched-chain amino acid ABC transporter permease [Alphaproteobacteria bacterium]|nr:branched-chain amino acid ABC transporter permease [Alphaproteobacteria bacterium]MDP6515894.1 branched-chain amino acid ABC transporter permease [Alphaproteobacteria bacterium]